MRVCVCIASIVFVAVFCFGCAVVMYCVYVSVFMLVLLITTKPYYGLLCFSSLEHVCYVACVLVACPCVCVCVVLLVMCLCVVSTMCVFVIRRLCRCYIYVV